MASEPLTPGDPRLAVPQDAADIRPVVVGRPWAPSGLTIGISMAVFAVLLFLVLDARRRASEAPAVRTTAATLPARAGDPPPLYVPPAMALVVQPVTGVAPATGVQPSVPFVLPEPPTRQPRAIYGGPPVQTPTYVPPPGYVTPTPVAPPAQLPEPEVTGGGSGALVLDRSGAQAGEGAAAEGAAPPSPATARATATTLANRTTTVPQGTLIPAVLETGFDSTKAGFARAIVSRDVRGFDGKRVLIPRGSRLTGEYAGGAEAGQRRAVINWTRLVRPDGVAIAIGSPATDAVGRNGVRAQVNSHLLARIFPAILQSALDIGVNLASRPANGSVLLSLPGGGGGSGLAGGQNQPAPTMTVRPGTSIAIFVSRDLDFTGVGNP